MNNSTPPLKQLNRTFIGSVLFIDIVGYSMRTVPDQLVMKELLNSLLSEAILTVAPAERIMVDTGDGAGIAFLGDPEDALFAALSLRDAIHEGKVNVGEPGFVRMGVNLGPLKIVRDINGHTNMIGDGVNDAQRVMSFSEPGQVMVSRSYYDIISRFSHDYEQLFVYEGMRHDKHVREHEVYRFGPASDNENLEGKLRDRSRARLVHTSLDPVPGLVTPIKATQQQAAQWVKLMATVLIATLVGVVMLVGAGWFWSSRPEPERTLPLATTTAAPALPKPVGVSPPSLKDADNLKVTESQATKAPKVSAAALPTQPLALKEATPALPKPAASGTQAAPVPATNVPVVRAPSQATQVTEIKPGDKLGEPAPAVKKNPASTPVVTVTGPAPHAAGDKANSSTQPGAPGIQTAKPAVNKSETGGPETATTPTTQATPTPATGTSSTKVTDAPAPAGKPGTLKLAIQPWGEIYVDGGKRGISPPLKSLNLPPGKHKIEIRNGSFTPYKETIEIKSGKEATVRFVF